MLSYYLIAKHAWQYTKKGPFTLPIRNRENENLSWYKRGNDFLCIWGVGGQSNFKYAAYSVLDLNKRQSREESFNKIVILTDRDEEQEDRRILANLEDYFSDILTSKLENRKWVDATYSNLFDERVGISLLVLIIPFDRDGAIETFLVDAMAEEDEDTYTVIEQARGFIGTLRSEKYLQKARDIVKAELGVTWAIMFPEKTFSRIDEMLMSIPWENYAIIQDAFLILEEI